MRKIGITVTVLVLLILGCAKQKIGYLDTENARYIPDTINVYKNIDPQSKRAINKAPWTSLKIVGVSGTNPVLFEFADVKGKDGGSAEVFKKCVTDGKVKVMGAGVVQLFQEAAAQLPLGSYIVSVKVSTDDYSAVIEDAITFIVRQDEPKNANE